MIDFERLGQEPRRLSSDLNPLRIGTYRPVDFPNRHKFLEFPVPTSERVIVKFMQLVVQSMGIKVHITDF